MSYISTEAYNASVIYSFSELSPNDKFILDKNGEAQTCTLKGIQGVSGGITIRVVAPKGYVLSVSDGTTTFSKDSSEVATFNIPSYGTWIVTEVGNGITKTKNVVVDHSGEYNVSFANIYGIQRDITSSSPEWTRTDDAVGLTATASNSTVTGSSDFDNCYPWKDMVAYSFKSPFVPKAGYNLSQNLKLIYIPVFYYKRTVENNIETIKIADAKDEGFVKHPGSGRYIGAYLNGNQTPSGKDSGYSSGYYNEQLTFGTISEHRNNITARNGTGWYMLDIAIWSAIEILYLVEYATNNSQIAIGTGIDHRFDYSYGQAWAVTLNYNYRQGSTDGLGTSTGNIGDHNLMVYRGIENLWGVNPQMLDGILVDENNNYYICESADVTKYTSNTITSDYKKLSYPCISSASLAYVTQLGYDPDMPWVMLPTETSNGSATTYYCDAAISGSGVRNVGVGCGFNVNPDSDPGTAFCGIFNMYANNNAESGTGAFSTRISYIAELDTNHATTNDGEWTSTS